MPKKLADQLRIYARRRQTPLSLRQLYDFGAQGDSQQTLLRAAQYLHTELPIRLARMAGDIENLPYGFNQTPSVRRVRDWYVQSFCDVIECPRPATPEDDGTFTRVLDVIKRRHSTVVSTMALGLQELKTTRGITGFEIDIHDYLDRFYMLRIGVRMLIGQYVALHTQREGFAGIVCARTEPAAVARESADAALQLCKMTYGCAPKIEIVGKTDLTFTYIPSHLHHMIIELLKNSLRAVVEFHGTEAALPAIKIVLADGREDVAIKVSDEGGGIPRSGMDKIWTYLYTTAKPPTQAAHNTDFDLMAGYGYGLPITRLYARYFGGDLQVISMESYGTDAYLHLNRLGNKAEVLPEPADTFDDE
ncbi:pyruvate dehydrogenase kinase [Candidatus Poribacteria bacterium]|nr:pyruvate dehydrogenase kinase [Candidatus Poribacteria bacterium]